MPGDNYKVSLVQPVANVFLENHKQECYTFIRLLIKFFMAGGKAEMNLVASNLRILAESGMEAPRRRLIPNWLVW